MLSDYGIVTGGTGILELITIDSIGLALHLIQELARS